MERNTILEVRNLSKNFLGVRALDGVELSVACGEVHAVCGENGAGKSTLMNIIFGDLQADSGEILLHGKPVHFKSPKEAIDAGVAMIHQEISLVPTLSVAENIWLNREALFTKAGLISSKRRSEATVKLLNEKLKIDINVEDSVSALTVAQMQLVEIARAVSCNASIIIMDEPTSTLSEKEVQVLFRIVRELAQENVAVIFITHKIEELMDICDRVSVYRDGRYIGTRNCKNITRDELVSMIIGRELTEQYPNVQTEKGEVLLEVENLCGEKFRDISFHVQRGEIVGFSGLVGAGRSEIVRAIFGIDCPTKGTIRLGGKEVRFKTPEDAVNHGLAMVTEDRLRMGIIAEASVKNNISIASLNHLSNVLGFVNGRRETEEVNQFVDEMSVKVSDINIQISSLSGGNQQKAIVSRWLMTKPQLLILDEPTRGIDVGAKREIYDIMCNLAKQGMAVIMVSSEMPEIMGLCDRIFVIRDGNLVYETTKGEATQELLGSYALG